MTSKTKATTTATLPAAALLPDPLFTRSDLADILGVRKQTISKWAMIGTGPKITRIGRLVRYRRSHVEQWLNGNSGSDGDGDADPADPTEANPSGHNPSGRGPARRRNSSRRD